MVKKKIIDIEAEFEGVEFDEAAINRATGVSNRPSSWKENVTEANRKKHADPEIANRLAEANRRSAQDPIARKNRAEANRRSAQDPMWHNALLEGRKKIDQKAIGKKMASNPEWRKNNIEQNRNTAKDPKWLEKVAKNNKLKRDNPEHIKKHQAGIDKRTQDPEWRRKQAERAKPVITPYGIFGKLKDAAAELLHLGVVSNTTKTPLVSAANTIRYNIKKKKEGWKYISQEEYTKLTGKEL